MINPRGLLFFYSRKGYILLSQNPNYENLKKEKKKERIKVFGTETTFLVVEETISNLLKERISHFIFHFN